MTPSNVTLLLARARQGAPGSQDALIEAVYMELRAMARRQLARESPGHTLQPTALVHDAYVRLVVGADSSWENRRHFFGAAAEAMRRVLIDHARGKATARRGGHRPAD